MLAVDRGNDPAYLGINTPAELVAAEDVLARRIVDRHLAAGVLIRSREAARIGPEVVIAPGVDLCGPVELSGRTHIAAGVVIDSHTVLHDTVIGPGAHVQSFSHLEGAQVGADCQVGPYARLRLGAVLEEGAKVGNFVEMKKIGPWRRRQGQPPDLSRRRHRGGPGQHRRRHHHLQL